MLLVVFLFLFLPVVAIGATSGAARIIDGDTIHIAGQRVRLYGIDAAEINQLCQRKGIQWQCGIKAAEKLKELTAGSIVSCTEIDRDRYGRIVAVCIAKRTEVNAAMVLSGMALAYRKYSDDYISHEASAKAARRGLWSGQFTLPWEWRRGTRLPSKDFIDDDTNGCRIKGNINSKGVRLYHMPHGRWYAETVVTVSKGERWFCSEDEAIRAGWRRAGILPYMPLLLESGY